jgi:hypothetical protein
MGGGELPLRAGNLRSMSFLPTSGPFLGGKGVGLRLYYAIFFAKFGPFPEKKNNSRNLGLFGRRPCQLATCAKFLAKFRLNMGCTGTIQKVQKKSWAASTQRFLTSRRVSREPARILQLRALV